MRIKQKTVVTATSMVLSIAAVLIPAKESIASILVVGQHSNKLHFSSNYLVEFTDKKSQQLIVVQRVISGYWGIGKGNFVSCLNQQRSPFTSFIELLMRLLIIGSFGSVEIAGYSSFVERYFQVINKDLKIIYYSILLLLYLQIVGIAIVLMSSPASSISSTIIPSSSCILGNRISINGKMRYTNFL